MYSDRRRGGRPGGCFAVARSPASAADAVLAAGLGAVQRLVGALEERLGVASVLGERGGSDGNARSERDPFALEGKGRHRLADALSHLDRLLGGEPRQGRQVLVAAEPARD